MHLVFYSGSKKSCEKGFSGIESCQGGDCRDVYTHLLCKRLYYVLSVNWIHTNVFLSVNQIQSTSYMIIFMTVTVVMPMDRCRIMTGADILSIPSTSFGWAEKVSY